MEKEKFIKAVAERVKHYGYKFEDTLRDKERDNPKFAFLRNSDVSSGLMFRPCEISLIGTPLPEQLPEYHLYRFCVDSRYRLPTPGPDDFEDEVSRVTAHGPCWHLILIVAILDRERPSCIRRILQKIPNGSIRIEPTRVTLGKWLAKGSKPV